jgi:hypothetical protein
MKAMLENTGGQFRMVKKIAQILNEGRGKILPLSPELVTECVTTQKQKIQRIARVALPEDIHVRGAYYDPPSGYIMFILYSEKFEPVPPGIQFPLFHDIEMLSLDVTPRGGAKQ